MRDKEIVHDKYPESSLLQSQYQSSNKMFISHIRITLERKCVLTL